MPTVKKINPPTEKVKSKRGRKPKSEQQVMYVFRCSEGCELKAISPNVEAQCGTHRKEMKLVVV